MVLKTGWCFEEGEHESIFATRQEAAMAVRSAVPCTCSECEKELDMESKNTVTRPKMASSIKLNRTIACVELRKTWKNAYRMWLENPDLMTSSQQDRLTARLYASAKEGIREVVTINGMSYCLVYVEGLAKWEM